MSLPKFASLSKSPQRYIPSNYVSQNLASSFDNTPYNQDYARTSYTTGFTNQIISRNNHQHSPSEIDIKQKDSIASMQQNAYQDNSVIKGKRSQSTVITHSDILKSNQSTDPSKFNDGVSTNRMTINSFYKISPLINNQKMINMKTQKMLEAKFERDQKKLELQQLEARIKKLQMDEEKTVKRINDAVRQQEFWKNIKNQKAIWNQEKQQYLKYKQDTEDFYRQQINQTRQHQRQSITRNIHNQLIQNHSQGNQMRQQKARYQQSINKNNQSLIQELTSSYKEHKLHLQEINNLRCSQQNSMMSKASKDYFTKIQQAEKETKDLQDKMKKLESVERQMIERLHNTQQKEKQVLNQLLISKTQSYIQPNVVQREEDDQFKRAADQLDIINQNHGSHNQIA